MLNGCDVSTARDALHFLDPGCDRPTWHKIGRAGIAAGLTVDEIDGWSSTAGNYKGTRDVQAAFRTIKREGGTGPGTLIRMARDAGWQQGTEPQQRTAQATTRPVEQPPRPGAGMSADEVFNRFEAATNAHPYVTQKRAAGVPLDGLRVVPAGDTLMIQKEPMVGALVVPVIRADGSISSLQFIAPPDVAARLKAKGKPSKLNFPGASMEGFFTVGDVVPGGVVHICEGIGQAWACWQVKGQAAVVCFGWGRVRTVAAELRQRDATARLILIPDVGKESDADAIANEVNGLVVTMPDGWPQNSDVNDLMQRDGGDVLAVLLESAHEPAKPEPRYKLLTAADLRDLPPLAWRVKGVLPAVGLAALVGPSASGKSFLALDLLAAIASEQRWFDCRIEAAPVIYCALEGEAGFKLRAQAWEVSRGRALPGGLHMMMQPFKLTEPQDVQDLAAVVPAGAVVVIDTLNRAAPTADENSSKDMGEILQAAKTLQAITGGLVLLVHHTGKDVSRGMRGHSSLFAAMDAVVEVSRDGDRREWKVAKSKDGADGDAHPFKLHIETLGVDEHGDPVTSCVVMADHTERDVKRVKVPQGGNQSLVYSAIRGMFKDGISGKPGAPPLRPCIELEAAVVRGAGSLSCDSDRRTSRARLAITGLVSRGVLGLNEGYLWLV